MAKTTFYNRYNPKPMPKGTDFTGHPEVCNQLAAEECEISKILHQYENGEISKLPVVREAQYNDVMITPKSFEEAKQLVDSVTNDFMSLPKDIQRQFGSLENYVADIGKIATGDEKTLAKYSQFSNFSVNSPQKEASDGSTSAASGISSSSLSRSDSENVSTSINASPIEDFAVGKE